VWCLKADAAATENRSPHLTGNQIQQDSNHDSPQPCCLAHILHQTDTPTPPSRHPPIDSQATHEHCTVLYLSTLSIDHAASCTVLQNGYCFVTSHRLLWIDAAAATPDPGRSCHLPLDTIACVTKRVQYGLNLMNPKVRLEVKLYVDRHYKVTNSE